ncbi:MAG: hypothetical protein HQL82_14665 [Magnetococcales bacterium]|nr:hypothetical protein [Magnetococcales bacterium]
MKRSSLLLVGFVVIMAILLFPLTLERQNQGQPVDYFIDLPGPFHMPIKGDGFGFLLVSKDPNVMIHEGLRDTRPVMVLAARWLGLALGHIEAIRDPPLDSSRFRTRKAPELQPVATKVGADVKPYFRFYVAYALINALLLIVAFQLLMRMAGPALPGGEVGYLAIGALLLLNVVIEDEFWSPHSQIFNVVGPVFLMALALKVAENAAFFASWRFPILALVGGLGVLAYGNMVIFWPVMLLGGAWGWRRKRWPWRRFIGQALWASGAFVLPYLAWGSYLTMIQHGGWPLGEVGPAVQSRGYPHFWWMWHAVQKGAGAWVIYRIGENIGRILLGGLQEGWHILLVGGALGTLTIVRHGRAIGWMMLCRLAIGAGLFISMMVALYFALMGFYPLRICFGVIPSVIVINAILYNVVQRDLSPRGRQIMGGLLALVIGGVALFRYGQP